MGKVIVGIIVVLLLAYNDWELLAVLHSHVMEFVK